MPFSATENDIRTLFSDFGQPTEILMMTDRETGRARGFGFVTMETSEGMDRAIRGLDGHSIEGRALVVNEARERTGNPHTSDRGRSYSNAGPKGSRW
jgi:RNA recognition motif-containing protein